MVTRSVAIIGGGIVGLATAYQLLQRHPGLRVILFEKESGLGRHQTGHNSGVLHCGLYYQPGSAKARLAVQGIRSMVRFCQEHGIPHEICGKVVVAVDESELAALDTLYRRGHANGLEGLRLLTPQEIRELEPHASGVRGLHVPQEGIVDYAAVVEALASEVRHRCGDIHLSAQVNRLQRHGDGWVLQTTAGDFEAGFLINCAGLHSDRVGRKAGADRGARIVPFRGEYYMLRPQSQHLVRNLIYPVPNPRFPFLGVHFTRMIHGGIEAGPNAVLALAREGYRRGDISIRDTVETLTYRGFWNFLLRYPAMCWQEAGRSLSKALFCRSLQRLVPEIGVDDLSPGGAGVRAQALAPDGELVQDFCFATQERALHILNAPSPAATASLAIADEIVDRIEGKIRNGRHFSP